MAVKMLHILHPFPVNLCYYDSKPNEWRNVICPVLVDIMAAPAVPVGMAEALAAEIMEALVVLAAIPAAALATDPLPLPAEAGVWAVLPGAAAAAAACFP